MRAYRCTQTSKRPLRFAASRWPLDCGAWKRRETGRIRESGRTTVTGSQSDRDPRSPTAAVGFRTLRAYDGRLSRGRTAIGYPPAFLVNASVIFTLMSDCTTSVCTLKLRNTSATIIFIVIIAYFAPATRDVPVPVSLARRHARTPSKSDHQHHQPPPPPPPRRVVGVPPPLQFRRRSTVIIIGSGRRRRSLAVHDSNI